MLGDAKSSFLAHQQRAMLHVGARLFRCEPPRGCGLQAISFTSQANQLRYLARDRFMSAGRRLEVHIP